jgi:hypothetical protein
MNPEDDEVDDEWEDDQRPRSSEKVPCKVCLKIVASTNQPQLSARGIAHRRELVQVTHHTMALFDIQDAP